MSEIGQHTNGNGNGNGWRTHALGALWFILMAIVGWVATDATTARSKMADQLNQQGQEIGILKESQRNTERALARMESVLEDIRRGQQQERRR